ncbi:MAG: GNAT family N-acetyltransferase [Reichenbachiella sp.]
MKNYHYEDGLESERLISVFMKKEDWKDWSDFFNGNGDATFLPTFDETVPDEIAKKWVNHQLIRYEEENFGMQWLIEKSSGKKLGLCGLLYQDINGTLELEVGYSFFKSSWGQGYASEAAQLFRDYGFKGFEVDSIISLIDPKNVPSQKVAERNGMKKGAIVDWKGLKLNVWRISRKEWQER